jgi:hypothetical protein
MLSIQKWMRAMLSRSRPRVIMLALVAMVGALSITTAVPAKATTPDPYGTLELSGSSWLGGNGVDVYSNGPYTYVSNVYNYITVGGASVNVGMKWQCVELAQRLYTVEGWHSGTFPGVSGAADIYTSSAATMGMTDYANGHITSIVPGDMIVHGTSDTYSPGYGHVAIVNYVSGSTVYAVQQNAPATTTYTLTSGTLTGGSGTDILGIVHSPNNTSIGAGGGGGTTPIPTSSLEDSSNVLHVFTGTSSGNVYDIYWGSGVGPGVEQVGFTLGASVVSLSSQYVGGVIHVYAATSAGAVDDIYWGGGQSLGQRSVWNSSASGNVISSLVDSGGYQHVFTGTSSGNVYDTYWTGTGTATTWQVGYTLGASVVSLSSQYVGGVIHVYAATSAGAVDDIYWGCEQSLGQRNVWGNSASGNVISSQVDSSGVQHVFTGTASGNVEDTSWTGIGTATSWQPTSSPLGAAVVSLSSQYVGGVIHVYAANSAGAVDDVYWGGGATLTQRQVWSNSVSGNSISSLVDSGGVQHVDTVIITGDIYDTTWTGTGAPTTWQVD